MAQKNVLKYIILGMLAHRELAGYDIKKLFEEELGDFWYSNHSQIYRSCAAWKKKASLLPIQSWWERSWKRNSTA